MLGNGTLGVCECLSNAASRRAAVRCAVASQRLQGVYVYPVALSVPRDNQGETRSHPDCRAILSDLEAFVTGDLNLQQVRERVVVRYSRLQPKTKT